MNSWSTSTVFVIGLFILSLLILFAKAGTLSTRSAPDRVEVNNHVYSPAAADPKLRNPDRANEVTRNVARQAKKAVPAVVKEEVKVVNKPQPAASLYESAPQKTETYPVHEVPKDHVFYVVTGTFSSTTNAERSLAEMKKKGFAEAFVGTFDEGKFYCVINSTFPEETAAQKRLEQLTREYGMKPYVYHKKD